MMARSVRILVFSMVTCSLAAAFVAETAAGIPETCPCCAEHNCQQSAPCHSSRTACTCTSASTQTILPELSALPAMTLLGYVMPEYHPAYLFLSVEDIFHPPKAESIRMS